MRFFIFELKWGLPACVLNWVMIARPLVAPKGLERTGHDFKPSKAHLS
ncbi:hypothetical protein LbDm2_1081 [Levilactobacillus brevis]|jgi:hypothetical protein|nr:hypothetical protein LbDm2_1081 [Levilactobacillus brevis]